MCPVIGNIYTMNCDLPTSSSVNWKFNVHCELGKPENLECKLRVDFEIGQVRAEEQYKYDVLYAKSEADNQRFNPLF